MFFIYCWFILLCNFMLAATRDVAAIGVHSSTKCIDTEREALLQFKSGIQHDHCGLLSSWEGQGDCCRWRGIRCNNHSGHVTVLHLRGLESSPCLEGKMDSSLFELKYLKYLDLCMNTFSQTIPKSIGSLSYLEHLNFSNAGFFGDFPIQLGNLSKLQYLDLSNNSLSGSLPSAFGKQMHTLSHLFLSYNQFEGPFPDSFSNLKSLKVLALTHNNFTENLSNVIQTLSNNNRSTNKSLLECLYLNENRFWGSVPKMISSFSMMRELYLDGNLLNETISQGIGQLSRLEKLGISRNSLNVTLTHSHFFNLSSLHELYLSDNPALVITMNSTWIPPFQLDIVSLRSCRLGPHFPKWLMTQTNASYLDISNAEISENITTSFWAESLFPNLVYLNMSHNRIQGVLPNLSESFQIFVVDLSSNLFEGSIHPVLGTLDSRQNPLDSSDFSCPEFKRSLELLDLSNNSLSGELPDCWMKFDELKSIHLEDNKFSGSIPASIGGVKQLQYLHLRHNGFSGVIPASLENCTSLVILNLAYNYLTGNISSLLRNSFKDLAILTIRGNHFVGKLPKSLCQLSKLEILDIAYNQISGTIPKCNYNLTAMSKKRGLSANEGIIPYYVESEILKWKQLSRRFKISLRLVKAIDLSSNELEGEIPNEISKLTGLNSLDLSRNRLTGSIPSNIGQLVDLEYLDLSNNQLFGEIPISLLNCTELGRLDLSNNNLSGRIPQLSVFDNWSYLENPLLCGPPLGTCRQDEHVETTQTVVDHNNKHVKKRFCISVALGFIIGLGAICGTLTLKRSWRDASFRFFDHLQHHPHFNALINFVRG